MAVRFLPLVLLLLSSVAVRAADKDPKEDPKFIRAVGKSIDKGIEWLLSKQTTTGKFPAFEDPRGEVYELGMHALGTLAVMKGGQPLDSIEVAKALKMLRTLYDRNVSVMKTYEAGLVLMVLEAKYTTVPPRKKPGQKPKKPRKNFKISAADRKWATEITLWLSTKQRPPGLWRYPEHGQDLSNTQYAALGLWSAHRMGIEIDPGVVRRMLEETMRRQQKQGVPVPFILDPKLHKRRTDERRSGATIEAKGWKYMPEEIRTVEGKQIKIVYPYSGSMTSAGIAILGIGRDILGKDDLWFNAARDRQLRRAMWEGLAWIQNNWTLEDNPGQPGNWPFYWLYGLERCCRVSGVEHVGIYDWYYMGCMRLMDDQRDDGSWPKHQRMRPPGDQNVQWWSDQVDTAFAILFLSQATPALKTPPPTITGSG
jgi:hypothetical protein